MTKIKQYELDSTIHEDDKVIGTDGNPGVDLGRTKNFTVAALTAYLNTALEIDGMIGGSGTLNTIPMWTPDGTTLGDSIITTDTSLPVETDGIVVNGKFRVELPAGTSAFNVSNEVVNRINARFDAGIIDYNSSTGTAGQVLTSTGTAVSWVDVSSLSGNVDGSGTLNTIPMWTPDGNTLGDSIVQQNSSGTIAYIAGRLSIDDHLTVGGWAEFDGEYARFNGEVQDSSGSPGTSGQILSSTGTATQWIDGVPSNNIVGSGTLDTIAMFTPDGQTIGNSDIIRTAANTYQINSILTVPTSITTTSLNVSNIFAGETSYVSIGGTVVIGNEDTDILTVTSTSTFNNNVTIGSSDTDEFTVNSASEFNGNVIFDPPGYVEFRGAVKDAQGDLGTAGQVLISTGTATNWVDQTDTTYTHSSAQAGSDAVIRLTDGVTDQDVTLVAGNSISLTDDGSNNITIAATGGAANTEYDLNAGIDGGNGKIRLIGSDATTDIVTITPGNNIVITSPSPNELSIATASDVVTYDLESAQNGSNVDVSLTGTDATTDTVSLIAGANITLTDDGSNNITIDSSSALTYDLIGTYNATDTILTLQGSDATSDTFTLHAGPGISFGQDAVLGSTTISLDITDNVTGSGTSLSSNIPVNSFSGLGNVIAMFTPNGTTVGDSIISQHIVQFAQGNPVSSTVTIENPDGGDNFLVVDNVRSDGAVVTDLQVTNITGTNSGTVVLNGNAQIGNDITDLLFLTSETTLYGPVKDVSNTLGSQNQVLVANASSQLEWTNVSDLEDNVTGSGTLNTIPMWTPDGTTLGDSFITIDTTGSPFVNVSVPLTTGSLNVQNIFGADGGFVTLSGNVVVGNASTDVFSINGTATFNADVTLGNTSAQDLTVNAVTVFNSSARFASQLVDTGGASGLSGMVLTSTGTGVDWVNVSDLTDNVTGSGTAGKLPYWNPDGATLADSLITQTSDNSITIGIGATATGSEAISLSRSEARADYSFAHGYESITDGEFSVTLGKGGYTAGDHSAAIGYKGISLGQSAISGGHSSSAGGDGAIALGHNASAGNYGVAKATSTFPNDQTTFDIYGIVGTVAVGTFLRYGPGFDVADPRIEVTQFTDLGNGAATITIASGIRPIAGELLVFEEQTPQRNDHQGGVALGNDAFSLGQGAVALGQDAVADADFAVAIGRTASTSTEDSIALGGGSTKILIEALVYANSYTDDTAAAAGGVAIGELYRNGNVVQIRLT